MNNIKTTFSISDLENLSGVKAHTIRVWERRYGILTPERGETNLRSYTLDDLRKLLNIAVLTEYGIKISKVARMGGAEIEKMVVELRSTRQDIAHILHQYKLSMMTFDQTLFGDTTDHLLTKMPFREVFMGYFLPFLEEVGLMWQTATIQPAHEHFISNLIRMYVVQQTALAGRKLKRGASPDYVLFLPFGEIHELGLLYLQYEIVASGKACIYLGSNMPLDSLYEINKLFTGITYITYITVLPEERPLGEYIITLERKCRQSESALWVVGRRVSEVDLVNNRYLELFTTLHAAVAKFG